jgi:hypothetical protein
MTRLILFCLVTRAGCVEADQSNRQTENAGTREVLAVPI